MEGRRRDVSKYRGIPLAWLILVAVVIVALINVTWASGDCKGHSCNDHGGVVTLDSSLEANTSLDIVGGSVTNKSSGLSLANALGDVDIGDCIVSKQKGNVIWSWQNYDYNADCLATKLDQSGKHAEAAALRCQAIPLLAAISWPGGQDCEAAMTLRTPAPPAPPPPTDEDEDEDAARYEAMKADILADLKKAAPPPPPPPPPVVNQVGLTDQQRQELAEVFKQ
jgi:hypothetical protein